MSKANGLEIDKHVDCMDISFDNRTLALGCDKIIKLYSFDYSLTYWFESKGVIYLRRQYKNEIIRLIKWNRSEINGNLLAVLFGEAKSFYIMNVKEEKEIYYYNLKGIYGLMKEFVWVPGSKEEFLTGSDNNTIYLWNLTETGETKRRREEKGFYEEEE